MKRQANATASPGVIDPDCLYTAKEARARLGLGDWAWRSWRRAGLKVLTTGGRSFVLGRDIISFIDTKQNRDQSVRK